jgi:hypothetical protein
MDTSFGSPVSAASTVDASLPRHARKPTPPNADNASIVLRFIVDLIEWVSYPNVNANA